MVSTILCILLLSFPIGIIVGTILYRKNNKENRIYNFDRFDDFGS